MSFPNRILYEVFCLSKHMYVTYVHKVWPSHNSAMKNHAFHVHQPQNFGHDEARLICNISSAAQIIIWKIWNVKYAGLTTRIFQFLQTRNSKFLLFRRRKFLKSQIAFPKRWLTTSTTLIVDIYVSSDLPVSVQLQVPLCTHANIRTMSTSRNYRTIRMPSSSWPRWFTYNHTVFAILTTTINAYS